MIDNKIRNKLSKYKLISDRISKHNQSFWILGLLYGSITFSFNNFQFRLFSYLYDFSVYINQRSNKTHNFNSVKFSQIYSGKVENEQKLQGTPQMCEDQMEIKKFEQSKPKTKDFSISINQRSQEFGSKLSSVSLKIKEWYKPSAFMIPNDYLFKEIPSKIINLFYNMDPSILNYLFHIDYPNLFNTYWLTGFLETNLTYLSINLNNLTIPAQISGLSNGDRFINDKPKIAPLELSPSRVISSYLFPKRTDVKFELHLYDKNLYNLLMINKVLKGKILLINETYKLILKLNWGEVKKIMKYLDDFPFLSLKQIKYLKIRKIYEICKTKKNYYNKGIKLILSINSLVLFILNPIRKDRR